MAEPRPQSLKGRSLAQLEAWCRAADLPDYRGRQLYHWLYAQGVTDAAQMINLPAELRTRIVASGPLMLARIVRSQISSDGLTSKHLVQMDDGERVESISMIHGKRRTICISSQVGCNLGCTFCATGAMGLSRDLSAGEIVDQYLLLRRSEEQPVTNIVFMGMGEPFLNYDAVIQAADIISHSDGGGLSPGKITISTVGIVPMIERFTAESQPYQLAISLSSADDAIRNEIMPVNRRWPIDALLDAARKYSQSSGRRITFEHVLLGSVNDSVQEARTLRKRLHGIPCKVNLIPFNSWGALVQPPTEAAIDAFASELLRGAFPVTVRRSKGADISAGCGQLAVLDQSAKAPA